MPQIYHNDTPISQMPASYPASRVTHESVSVTGDGVKTFAQLFAELNALIDRSKLTRYSIVQRNGQIYQIQTFGTTENSTIIFARYSIGGTLEMYAHVMQFGTTNAYRQFHATQSQTEIQDISSSVEGNGSVITLYY